MKKRLLALLAMLIIVSIFAVSAVSCGRDDTDEDEDEDEGASENGNIFGDLFGEAEDDDAFEEDNDDDAFEEDNDDDAFEEDDDDAFEEDDDDDENSEVETPFIGPNGNWWIGDVDTGIPADENSSGDEKEPEEDKSDETSAYGLYYKIPEGFRKVKETVSEYTFSDGTAYLYFNYYDEERLEEIGVDPAIDVRSYAVYFCSLNDFSMENITYDEAANKAEIKTKFGFSGTVGGDESDPFNDPYGVDLPPEYFHFQVRRGTDFLYVITANCPLDMVEKYEPIFEAWHNSVSVE